MLNRKNRARLFVSVSLGHEEEIPITGHQYHYLRNVLRIKTGQTVTLFNGLHGEWKGIVAKVGKNLIVVQLEEQIRHQTKLPNIWFLFAPLKKSRMDFAVEKVTEIGVSRVLPVATEYTQNSRIPDKRLQNIAMEASEQCGGLDVPIVSGLRTLTSILSSWPKERLLIYCDETAPYTRDFPTSKILKSKKLAVLIGPEGGFSPNERELIRSMDESYPVSLGKQKLRAETAAVAALTLVRWHFDV